ncbi:transcriptional regulator [Methylobacterium sp. WSM2598]|uniref:transcriptional regulator n=1 Tax=Methylobacterium sp. WSM2598 TaxID=398261 RepID=UPI00039BEFBB|nr:transcriptional regulator [Methylobacterium sp. WSM2598]
MNAPMRLSALAQQAQDGETASLRDGRTCLECGVAYETISRHSSFCSTGCRNDWNNRRLQRGAEIYDLWMAFRFQRPLARALNLLSCLNRLAHLYRQEDRAERAGRASWRAPEAVLASRPYLRAVRLVQRRRT